MHECEYAYVFTCTFIHTHTRTHSGTHAYIHMPIYTCIHVSLTAMGNEENGSEDCMTFFYIKIYILIIKNFLPTSKTHSESEIQELFFLSIVYLIIKFSLHMYVVCVKGNIKFS